MSAKIRTAILVSLVTVLIWLWAEGESLDTETFNPSVMFVQNEGGDMLIEPYERWAGSVRVRVQGSKRALTDAKRDLSSEIRLKIGDRGMPTQPGDQQIVDLAQAIQSLPSVGGQGLSVQEVTPANAVVRIVKLVSRELPVRAVVPPDIALLGQAAVSPARVMVRLSESQDARLPADAFATVELTRQDLASARDDTALTMTSRVRLPEALDEEPGVEITPPRVSVTFRLKRSVDSVTVATVPVWFSLPSTEGDGWDIELIDKFLRDVTFTGPTDAIARIRSREVVPLAEVRLSSDELENGIEAKEAVIVDVPQGVESGVAVKTVRLKVTRRKSEAEPGPEDLAPPPERPAGDGEP
jgi:hypothetical protein